MEKMCELFLVHTMKAYRASVNTAALMPNLGIKWKLVVNFRLLPLYPA